MIHLLVVDDEPIIINSLYQMIRENNEWQMEVFKASSSSQALEIARSNRIDVILSDICMPNIDGLELYQLIQAEWPACRAIFLTGYDSFEYAQKAIRQKSAGYVLKVEGDRAIMDALQKCIMDVETERNNQRLLLNVKAALPLLRRELVQELLQDRRLSAGDLVELMQRIEFPLDSDMPALLLLGHVRRAGGNAGSVGLDDVYSIISVTEQCLGGFVRQISVSQPQDTIVTLYQPKPGGSWQGAYRHVLETLEQIQSTGSRQLGLTISYTAASTPCHWDGLAIKHAELEETARFFAFDDQSILTDASLSQRLDAVGKKAFSGYERIVPTHNQLSRLKLAISSGDEEGMCQLLDELYHRLRMEDIPIGVARDIYYSLALVFQRCINEAAGELVKWNLDSAQIMNMESHFGWGNVFEYFKSIGKSVILGRNSEKSNWNIHLVKQINSYVNSNLSEDIGLLDVAERFHFHPSYLARLYKHMTGITLGQHIINLRMEKARGMLMQRDIQINDIAKALGFSSVAYFGKFFKANSGQTPSDYRRQITLV